jgi:uncharacterized protein YcnI
MRFAAIVTFLFITVTAAYGHVTVQPKQSSSGATETYSIRVPTEKFVPTVRVEIEFPTNLNILSFEPKASWKIEEKKNSSGKIIGVTLAGSIPTGESVTFNFRARNPIETGKLIFKAIQIYEDGTKSEWTGPEGSRTPSPIVELK